MKKSSANLVAQGGIIAALYIILAFLSSAMGLSSGIIQLRFSEMLCILPCFTPAGIPGLFVGCAVSNLLVGGGIIDTIIGGLATLIGAFGTYALRKNRWLMPLPPIIANALTLPFVMSICYGFSQGYWYFFITTLVSEALSIYMLGELLYNGMKRAGQNVK